MYSLHEVRWLTPTLGWAWKSRESSPVVEVGKQGERGQPACTDLGPCEQPWAGRLACATDNSPHPIYMRCRLADKITSGHSIVNFLQSTRKRHPIAHLWGQVMGCFSWVQFCASENKNPNPMNTGWMLADNKINLLQSAHKRHPMLVTYGPLTVIFLKSILFCKFKKPPWFYLCQNIYNKHHKGKMKYISPIITDYIIKTKQSKTKTMFIFHEVYSWVQ